MSGNGRPTGTRRSMKATRRKPAASRRTRAAGARTVATTLPRRTSGSRARSSRAARTCARRTIADAIGRLRAMPSRSIHQQVILASAASGEKALTRGIENFKFQFYQQPQGWPGAKVTTDMPVMVNIRQDPFERTPSIASTSVNDLGGVYMNDFFAREFWRFVSVQEEVARLARTAIDYPPMQDSASFNLEAVKQQIDKAIRNKPGN